jgi:hypothetical protein
MMKRILLSILVLSMLAVPTAWADRRGGHERHERHEGREHRFFFVPPPPPFFFTPYPYEDRWVPGHYEYDQYGHQYWVPGHYERY